MDKNCCGREGIMGILIRDFTSNISLNKFEVSLIEDGEMFKVNQTIKINDLVNRVTAATTTDEVNAISW
jgi:hypothetical protein